MSQWVKGLMSILVSAACVCSMGAMAADAATGSGRIAFVDGNEILQQYEPTIEEKLQAEFQKQQDQLLDLQKKLTADRDRYKRDAAIMSDKDKAALEDDFKTAQADFQKLSTAYNEQRAKRGNEELEALLDKVKSAVSAVAKDQKYDIVLQRGAAVYLDEKTDITDKVLDKMGKK